MYIAIDQFVGNLSAFLKNKFFALQWIKSPQYYVWALIVEFILLALQSKETSEFYGSRLRDLKSLCRYDT